MINEVKFLYTKQIELFSISGKKHGARTVFKYSWQPTPSLFSLFYYVKIMVLIV